MLMKLSRRSSIEIRMQDEVIVQNVIIVLVKGWKSSNIWEKLQQIKILSRKKLRAD